MSGKRTRGEWIRNDIYLLTDGDLEYSDRIANIRNSKEGKVPSSIITDNKIPQEIHYMGAKAELVVCKRLKYPLDEKFRMNGDKLCFVSTLQKLRVAFRVGDVAEKRYGQPNLNVAGMSNRIATIH